ncbi:helix-turn-helix domain-containing protein [Paractinoplanes atraurantiacus]|uniref:Helix-turn-helix domain-containing protein n=1 Tax=Paractinoplanes atraurantiacus TaxID=1036182 RepID=A0A285HP31_9ACTN|nr:helix-turn-helix transcriptional regulator [Actinoplanes atraurantiacus]SNY37343.1 Helix-turn-helix domain-containing protein [Actinoplanes atraurantiacus]
MPRYSNIDIAIGERIRIRRLLRGWSIRHAASRAGISHASWSRIERGLQAFDNRFVIADIATALECAPVELTGVLVPAADLRASAAQAGVRALREALVSVAPSEPGGTTDRDLAELRQQMSSVRDLRERCDYAAAVRLLPGLLRHSHAQVGGPTREGALRVLREACFVAYSSLNALGHPAEAWLAAERCHEVAGAIGDKLLMGFAAYARACAATACGSFSRGRTLAEDAIDLLEPLSGRPGVIEVVGQLHLSCGYSYSGLRRNEESGDHMAAAINLGQRVGESKAFGLFFGPTNVNIWRMARANDSGEPARAVNISEETNPAILGAAMRIADFHIELARAYGRLKGREGDAARQLLAAERLAPQHLHTSSIARETARHLITKRLSRSNASAMKRLCGRMGVAVSC